LDVKYEYKVEDQEIKKEEKLTLNMDDVVPEDGAQLAQEIRNIIFDREHYA
jgi:hypothetical protein